MAQPLTAQVFADHHAETGSWSYVVHDPVTRAAMIVDPVLDYDAAAARTRTGSAQRLLDHVRDAGLNVRWIVETHAHADHLSAAGWLRAHTGARVGIGSGIRQVQATFADIYHLGADFTPDGRQFDHLFAPDESFALGELTVHVMPTPGHTSDSVSYRVGDAVFVGDTLFTPPGGSARCDFPGGDAGTLYDSVQRLFGLPADTRMFVCHDYPEGGRPAQAQTSVQDQRRDNIHLRDGTTREQYVALREARDRTLGMPRLILPAIQWNIRAGNAPPAEANGVAYLRIPLNRL